MFTDEKVDINFFDWQIIIFSLFQFQGCSDSFFPLLFFDHIAPQRITDYIRFGNLSFAKAPNIATVTGTRKYLEFGSRNISARFIK